jgi:hypothetical protein
MNPSPVLLSCEAVSKAYGLQTLFSGLSLIASDVAVSRRENIERS